jgi:hypothetical protein
MTQEKTVHLTTEELGLLSEGGTLTFAFGEETVQVSAKDLDCSLRELAEGAHARAGGIVLHYD